MKLKRESVNAFLKEYAVNYEAQSSNNISEMIIKKTITDTSLIIEDTEYMYGVKFVIVTKFDIIEYDSYANKLVIVEKYIECDNKFIANVDKNNTTSYLRTR